MTSDNRERKESLASRVEESIELSRIVADKMETRTYHKKDKKCSVCGKSFEGTAKADVCGSTCRKRKQRAK